MPVYDDGSVRKMKELEGKINFMVDDYMLDKVLDRIKETKGIEELDNTKILINTNDKLPDLVLNKLFKMLWY